MHCWQSLEVILGRKKDSNHSSGHKTVDIKKINIFFQYFFKAVLLLFEGEQFDSPACWLSTTRFFFMSFSRSENLDPFQSSTYLSQ